MSLRRLLPRMTLLVALFLLHAALGAVPRAVAQSPASFAKYWGPLWYLRTWEQKDDLTLVYGGVRGCTGLVWQDVDNKKTYWIFLERGTPATGKLFTSMGKNAPIEQETIVPGQFIVSETLVCYPPKDADRRELSYLLIDVYTYLVNDPNGPLTNVTHTPFLRLKGWGAPGGASLKEATEICNGLGLNLVLDGGTKGYVSTQTSLEGALRDPTGTDKDVHVTLDNATIVTGPTPGDSWVTAIDVLDPDGDHIADAEVRLTVDYTDNTLSYPPPVPVAYVATRRDAFFKLPTSAQGKMVTVTQQPGTYDRLCLTAWQLSTTSPPVPQLMTWGTGYAASAGLRPKLQFFYPPDATCLVMVENQFRDLANIKVHFEW